jgi:polysaccharide export outer membrane protein
MSLYRLIASSQVGVGGLTLATLSLVISHPAVAQTMAGATSEPAGLTLPAMAEPLIPPGETPFDRFDNALGDRSPLPESYVLGPGDRIRVDIFNVPEFSGPENGVHEVLVDGTLTLPMVGIVDVQGMTLAQTQQVLTAEYARLLTRPPQLTVTLLDSRPVRIAIAGEVNRPGTYTAEFDTPSGESRSDTSRQWPTLTKVIQEAGGITQQANIRSIEIRRPQRNAPDAVMTANLWDLISSGDIKQDIRLRDGDTVIIPTATNPSPAESVAISDANFSPSEIPVQVVGEVVQPGTIEVPANATLNQAILAAGGFKNARARTSSVELVRLNPDGTVDRRQLQVDLSVAANNENNPILRPDDVVMVDRTPVASAADALGVVLNPLTALTAILRIFGF